MTGSRNIYVTEMRNLVQQRSKVIHTLSDKFCLDAYNSFTTEKTG